MAKHARQTTEEQRERLERNRAMLLALLSGTSDEQTPSPTSADSLTLTLERFVVDRRHGRTVPYEGLRGVGRLLAEVAQSYPQGELIEDGHLVGVRGMLLIEGHPEPVELTARVGAGAQLVLEIGPASQIGTLLDAIAVFERQLHVAGASLKRDVELVAQGYNPGVSSASDVVLVPGSRNALINTHLARTGRYGRDLMRCTAATRIALPVSNPHEAAQTYRLLTALAPLLAFATDNTPNLRGKEPSDTPRMARSLVVQGSDPARCGIVTAAMHKDFDVQSYERWLEELRPIVFTSDGGVTFSCGTSTLRRLMEEREISPYEAERLLAMAWPWVRWSRRLELCCADALPPRLAGAYAALVKGLVTSDTSRAAAAQLLHLDELSEEDVADAWQQLSANGWQAIVYGRPAGMLIDELDTLARHNLTDPTERRRLDALTQLWEVRCVPRDLLSRVRQAPKPRTREQEVIERYGEGALIPYDDLQGEPPAGATGVLHLR